MVRRGFWLLGLSAPVLFALAVAMLGYLKPGYSHIYHTMSELGEAGSVTTQPAALVFTVTGIMITVFGYNLHRTLMRDDKMVWSGILVMLYGLLDFVGSGVFPVDAGGSTASLVSTIHVYATLLGEFAAVGMPIWFLRDTEGAEDWVPHRGFSKIAFWVSLPLIGFLGYCILGHTPGQMDTPIGLAQRLLVGLFLSWIMAIAYSLMQKKTP
ncbi:DUF998 domain-containing protein [Candidatus Bathyarchaeota archaeon]|nr:DUF998 domain-containing protein [Candidatus Bathyarchaeota archaeon]